MKKILLCLLLVPVLLFSSCSGKDGTDSDSDGSKGSKVTTSKTDKEEAIVNEILASIGVEGVTVEVGEITGEGVGATASVVAQVPNYTELFMAAYAEKDPTQSLQTAILKKDYTTVEYKGYAAVTYEDGEPIVNTEELITSFVEQELIKAINAVSEAEEAEE
ncbi:MAG: hypothetical protein ACI3YK_00535 [Eubacteriales bacterium]